MTTYTDDQLAIMHLEEELNSALRKVATVIVGDKARDEAAWWMCANHAKFVIDHPNLMVEQRLTEMATRAGPPPTGNGDWEAWFKRVRNLRHNGETAGGKK